LAALDDLVSTSGAVNLFGSELKGATNSVVGLAGNLLSGSMKLSDYSKSLDTNTKLLGKLGKVVNALTMFAEQSLSEYQSLTGIGASFGKQMTEIKIAAAELGMSVEDMTKLFKDNAEGLSAFGGSTDSAISAFRQFSSSVLSSDVGTGLRRLGYTVSDINENLLTYAEIAEQDNQLERSVGRDRNQSALEFAKELDSLSKLTGKQRDELADQMKEARRQGDVQAFLTGQSADASEALTTGLTKISSTMGPQYAELFKDLLIRGAPTTDATRSAFVALGDSADEFQAQVDSFRSGMNTDNFSQFDQSISETQAAFTRYLNTEEGRQIGMLGGLTDISQAQGQLREDSYVFANRLNAAGDAAEDTLVKLQRITTEIERQQEIQMGQEDPRNLIDETIRLNETTREMVLATQQKALTNLEEMGVTALQKVQDAMPSVGEITNKIGGVVDNLFEAAGRADKLWNSGNGMIDFPNLATMPVENLTVNETSGGKIATLEKQEEAATMVSKATDAQDIAFTKVEDATNKLADLQATAAQMTTDGFTKQDPQFAGIQSDIERVRGDLAKAKSELLQKQADLYTAQRIRDGRRTGNYTRGFATGGNIPGGKFGVVGEAGPEFVSGPANVMSSRSSMGVVNNMMRTIRNVENRVQEGGSNGQNSISSNITDSMVSMLEGKLNEQNMILQNLLQVETTASETGKRQYKATRGLSGNMLKGIGA
jgi:hypothetical protein